MDDGYLMASVTGADGQLVTESYFNDIFDIEQEFLFHFKPFNPVGCTGKGVEQDINAAV